MLAEASAAVLSSTGDRDRLFNRQLLVFAKAGEAVTRVHLLGWFLRALKALPSALLGGNVPLGTQRQIF